MTGPPANGLSRQGLDAAFAACEAEKSNWILEGRLLRAQQRPDEAAARFAQAAEAEEALGKECDAKGLGEKALLHHFSAASCWALAGNFYRAIVLCDALLSRPDLSERWRRDIQGYADALRLRRAQWYAEPPAVLSGTTA